MITKLSIVNACLVAIGGSTVPDLEYLDVDTETALTKLDEAVLDVLSRGWWFNMENGLPLVPNADDGKVEAPKTILSFLSVGLNVDTEQLTVRGGYFYDMYNHTYDLRKLKDNDGVIRINTIIFLNLEDLPLNAQKLVREIAVLKMMRAYNYEANRIQSQADEVKGAVILLERDHIRITKENSSTSVMVSAFINAVGSNSFLGQGPRNPLGGNDR